MLQNKTLIQSGCLKAFVELDPLNTKKTHTKSVTPKCYQLILETLFSVEVVVK